VNFICVFEKLKHKPIKPYIFGGFRGDYLLDYRSVIIDSQGVEYELNTDLYDAYIT